MEKLIKHNELKLHKEIRDYMKIPLSSQDILNLVDGKANVIRYSNLYKYATLDECLYPYNAFVLLYEAKPRDGHWSCVTLHNNNAEFFCSYGSKIDESLNFVPEGLWKIESHQDKPYLLKLMYESPYKCSYNEFKFQKLKPGISNCGRYVAVRILLKELTLKEFKSLLFGPMSDEIVTLLTVDKSQIR